MAEVGCAGILVEDTFCGPIRELPPEGSLLALDALPVKAGGCAANVAIVLSKQGIGVDVVGCLGNDAGAKVLASCFEQHGIGCGRLAYTDEFPTSKTVILLIEGQDRRFFHVFGANKAFTVGHIDRDWLRTLKVFYLGGLFAMPAIRTEELAELLKFCRQQGIVTVVDVVVPQQLQGMEELAPLLPHIDWFIPNDDEAQRFTGFSEPREQLRTFQDHGANAVIVTCGEKGAVAALGEDRWECSAFRTECVDPSGGGDAFAAGVIAGIVRGGDMAETLHFASALGASVTRAVGTTDGAFTASETEAFLRSHPLEVRKLS
jgi:sugar/nucleoside kinase (ribokinase family)